MKGNQAGERLIPLQSMAWLMQPERHALTVQRKPSHSLGKRMLSFVSLSHWEKGELPAEESCDKQSVTTGLCSDNRKSRLVCQPAKIQPLFRLLFSALRSFLFKLSSISISILNDIASIGEQKCDQHGSQKFAHSPWPSIFYGIPVYHSQSKGSVWEN